MNNKIINNIISLIKKYSNPESGKPFEINKNINIIVKDGHANITINIDPKNIKLFENLRENLQKEILSLPDIISSNVIPVYISTDLAVQSVQCFFSTYVCRILLR